MICSGTIKSANAIVRRGPSEDDLPVAESIPQATMFSLVAKATDERNRIWYGFYHPNRIQYVSWIPVSAIVINGSMCGNLPDLSTQEDVEWGTLINSIPPILPIEPQYVTIGTHRGFGIVNSVDYPSIPGCRHPGFDFQVTTANVNVFAAYNGILVGIGRSSDRPASYRPATWGAVGTTDDNQYNVVIRTGGNFVLYGHLGSVEQSLFYGKRVKAGDIIGTLANQQGNTHLHLQIASYVTLDVQRSVRRRFGAIVRVGGSNPTFVIDPVFTWGVQNRGHNTSSATYSLCPSGNPSPNTYILENFTQAALDNFWGRKVFSYSVNQTVKLKCFNLTSNAVPVAPSQCVTNRPNP
jgi:hypothetical protein